MLGKIIGFTCLANKKHFMKKVQHPTRKGKNFISTISNSAKFESRKLEALIVYDMYPTSLHPLSKQNTSTLESLQPYLQQYAPQSTAVHGSTHEYITVYVYLPITSIIICTCMLKRTQLQIQHMNCISGNERPACLKILTS